MDKAHYLTSIALIRKDIKTNDLHGAQMSLEYLLKDFLSDGKLLAINNPNLSESVEGRNTFNRIHQLLIELQNEHPQIFPRFNLMTELEVFIEKVSEDGIVEFNFIYDYTFEDTLYGSVDLSGIDEYENYGLEYDEEAELDMMFPNKEDDDSWDE